MATILKNTSDTLIVEYGYHLYIDTVLDIDSKEYGTFKTDYNPSDKDILLTKVPPLEKIPVKRDISVETRHLHIVNKNNLSSVTGLAKKLIFVYKPKTTDERPVLVETSSVTIIDYSEKSVAIFTKDPTCLRTLRENEKFVKYNSGLTGPGLQKTPGYILAKSSRKYAEIISLLESGGAPVSPTDVNIDQYIGNDLEMVGDPTSDTTLVKIWGDLEFIESKLTEIDATESMDYRIVKKIPLEDNRAVYSVEMYTVN